MSVDARNRLQPSLLDRLRDDHRGDRREAESERVMSKVQLREAVLRDLRSLFNAVQSLDRDELAVHPDLASCVLNFGMPALTGQLASRLDITVVMAAIRDAIVRFEPRIIAETLEIHALEADSVLDTHNVIAFEIRGQLWSQPLPIEILLRTQLDLEAGQVDVRDLFASARAVAR